MPEHDVYRQLQRHLDRAPVPFPATESGVELRILRQLFSVEDARLVLCLSALPEPLSVIHRRVKGEMTTEALGAALDNLAERGLINRLGTRHGVQYLKAVFVVGFYEAQVNRQTAEFSRDFHQYLDEALGDALLQLPTVQLRTVPINEKIVAEHGIGRYDDIREAVRRSSGPFAAMNCICRQGKDLLDEPCRHHDTRQRESCLTIGVAAQAMIDRHIGRALTRDEMLAMLDKADHEGLVLQPQNTEDPLFVCCCCGCCCGVLTIAKKLPQPAAFFSTNYYAEVDAELCQECATCAMRCQMDAVGTGSGPTTVDLARCIGCGLCVTTCPSGAMALHRKADQEKPPRDTGALYVRMMRERYGVTGIVAAVAKKALGIKV